MSLVGCGVVLFQKNASSSIKEARNGNAFLDTNCTHTYPVRGCHLFNMHEIIFTEVVHVNNTYFL